jgi:integrase
VVSRLADVARDESISIDARLIQRIAQRSTSRRLYDLYELRHFAATWMLESPEDGGLGLSPADVAVQLGHRDGGRLVMTLYGHPSEDFARKRIQRAFSRSAASGTFGSTAAPGPLADRKWSEIGFDEE